jgi:hypothetical protein
MAEVDFRDGRLAGWIIGHQLDDETWCDGWIPFQLDVNTGRGWNTSTGSLDGGDLTLSSDIHSVSVKCHTHGEGFHGYVRNGRWVPV